jgi:hypothetical protein
MAFGMSNATSSEKYNREKLSPGEHICRVRDVRENNGFKGEGFFVDFEVVSGPSGAGFQSAYIVYPKKARGNDKMTEEQAFARELGKIQRAVAACSGLTAKQQGEINDARYQAAIARPVSPLKGRLIVVNAVRHVNVKKEETVYYELSPHFGDVSASVPAAAPANTNAPAKPGPALPVKAAKPAFVDAMLAAGYVLHEENADYCHNGVEVIELSELRTRLGY